MDDMSAEGVSPITHIADVMRELAQVADRYGLKDAGLQTQRLLEQLYASQFQLVVMGQFKRGKSSLINALLGADLMPVGAVPLTSVMTRIAWGSQPAATVQFQDGRRETLPVDRLATVVTERGNPSNRLGIATVDVQWPARLLQRGLVLVDTPGPGSTVQGNTATAMAALDEVDAALVVLGADPPLTADEARFLRDATKKAARVFYVQNKMDAVSPTDWQEALTFNATQLARVGDTEKPVRILSVSARWGLEGRSDRQQWIRSGFDQLERDLQTFLSEERAAALHESVARRARSLVEVVRLGVALRRSAVLLPSQQLQEREERLQRQLATIEQEQTVSIAFFRDQNERLVRALTEQLADFQRRARAVIVDEVGTWIQTAKADKRERVTPLAIDEEIRRHIRRWLLPWHDERGKWLEGEYQQRALGLIDRFQALEQAVEAAYGDFAGMSVSLATEAPQLIEKPSFSLNFSDPPALLPNVSRAWFAPFLPSAYAVKILQRYAYARTVELLDRNCGRVRYDLVDRLSKEAHQFEMRLVQHLAATASTWRGIINEAIEARTKHQDTITDTVTYIDQDTQRLQELGDWLANLDDDARKTSGLTQDIIR